MVKGNGDFSWSLSGLCSCAEQPSSIHVYLGQTSQTTTARQKGSGPLRKKKHLQKKSYRLFVQGMIRHGASEWHSQKSFKEWLKWPHPGIRFNLTMFTTWAWEPGPEQTRAQHSHSSLLLSLQVVGAFYKSSWSSLGDNYSRFIENVVLKNHSKVSLTC